ncbi:MAG: LpxI family protein [Nitrospina sp.]|nr:MAG: LpxI family protein [Nitrospina sp.]
MNTPTNRRIGLIAGAGDIPLYCARKAREKGMYVVGIAFTDEIEARLKPLVDVSYSLGITQRKKIFKTLHQENIKDILILGKVEKKMIFRPQLFDLDTLKAIWSFKTNQDKTVMKWVIEEVEKNGFSMLDQMEFMQELYPAKGVLTRAHPSNQAMEDIEYGWPIVRYMADQEIGQTIVVKNKTVIAVEGVEGTDVTIERGCRLSQGGCVVLKVSRTQQDYRYDSPGIGPKTMEGLIAGGASVLALEAGRIMIINREKVLEMADRAKVSIICV